MGRPRSSHGGHARFVHRVVPLLFAACGACTDEDAPPAADAGQPDISALGDGGRDRDASQGDVDAEDAASDVELRDSAGGDTSDALDATDTVDAADSADAAVKRTCQSSGWASEVVTASGRVIELEIDANDRVHLAFDDGATKIATRQSGNWATVTAPARANRAAFHPSSGAAHLCVGLSGFGAGEVFQQGNAWQTREFPRVACNLLGPSCCAMDDCANGGPYVPPCALSVDATGATTALLLVENYEPADEGYIPAVTVGADGTRRLLGAVSSYSVGRMEVVVDRVGTTHAVISHPSTLYRSLSSTGVFTQKILGCGDDAWLACNSAQGPLLGQFGGADIALGPNDTVYIAAPGGAAKEICLDMPQEEHMALFTQSANGFTQEVIAPLDLIQNSVVCSSWAAAPALATTPAGDPVVCWVQRAMMDEVTVANTGPLRCAWKDRGAFTVADVIPGVGYDQPPQWGAMRAAYIRLGLDVDSRGCCHVAYPEPSGAIRYATDCP